MDDFYFDSVLHLNQIFGLEPHYAHASIAAESSLCQYLSILALVKLFNSVVFHLAENQFSLLACHPVRHWLFESSKVLGCENLVVSWLQVVLMLPQSLFELRRRVPSNVDKRELLLYLLAPIGAALCILLQLAFFYFASLLAKLAYHTRQLLCALQPTQHLTEYEQ